MNAWFPAFLIQHTGTVFLSDALTLNMRVKGTSKNIPLQPISVQRLPVFLFVTPHIVLYSAEYSNEPHADAGKGTFGAISRVPLWVSRKRGFGVDPKKKKGNKKEKKKNQTGRILLELMRAGVST